MNGKTIRESLDEIWGPAPIVAGEDIRAYETLLEAAIAEWTPDTLREWMLVRHVADRYWELGRYQLFETAIVNAIIAEGLTREVLATEPGKIFELLAKTSEGAKGLSFDDQLHILDIPNREIPLNSQLARNWRQICYNAVGGNRDSVKCVESEIGAGRIRFSAEWALQAAIPGLLLLQRLKNGTQASVHASLAELERLKRSAGRKLNLPKVEPIAESSAAPTPCAAVDTISVHKPREASTSE